jgi:hypothetical protein
MIFAPPPFKRDGVRITPAVRRRIATGCARRIRIELTSRFGRVVSAASLGVIVSEATPIAGRFRGYLPVVVDLETGGFNPSGDAILQLAAVLLAMTACV